MGKVKKLLSTKEINPTAARYSNMYSFEICEDFHIHWRNLRLQFTTSEWEHFCNLLINAKNNWVANGKPLPQPDKTLPTYLIPAGYMNPQHGISPTNFRIEYDTLNGDAIHIHYKSIRLELSIKEFKEMALEFKKALENLEEK